MIPPSGMLASRCKTPSRFRQPLCNISNAIFLPYIFLSRLFFKLLARFQIQISIHELHIEFEAINPL